MCYNPDNPNNPNNPSNPNNPIYIGKHKLWKIPKLTYQGSQQGVLITPNNPNNPSYDNPDYPYNKT